MDSSAPGMWSVFHRNDKKGSREASGRITDLSAAGNVVAGNFGAKPATIFDQVSQKYGLPNGLLASVYKAESNSGDPRFMRSRAGALGPFQFMPGTAKQYGLDDPFNLEKSADAAGHYYGDLLSKYHGDVPKAAAAYNWGPGNVDTRGLNNAPAETRQYAASVAAGTDTQTVKVEIDVKNAPPGMRVVAKNDSGAQIPAKIGYSMGSVE